MRSFAPSTTIDPGGERPNRQCLAPSFDSFDRWETIQVLAELAVIQYLLRERQRELESITRKTTHGYEFVPGNDRSAPRRKRLPAIRDAARRFLSPRGPRSATGSTGVEASV
jgi:hypothetical protein